jgi:arginyl-tRNA synthetase
MKQYILPLLKASLQSIAAPDDTEIVLEHPRQADHGDLATNVALGLARSLKKSPRQVAEEIIGTLEIDPACIAGVEIAGPGFINFRFTPEFFQMRLEEMMRCGEQYGRTNDGNGIKTNVEYVSANPTGPLEWTGHAVIREYYFNNGGNQMRNLARSIHARYLQQLGHETTFPDDGYHGDYVADIAREAVTAYNGTLVEETEEHLALLQKLGEQWCFAHIRNTLASFGIAHDLYFNEDTLYHNGTIDEVVEELRQLGRVYEKDGAVWLRLEDKGLQDRVIIRSNGEPTYRLPDIAYHREKFRRGFELIVDIFGADHIATIPDIKAAMDMLGYDASTVRVVLNQMVSFVEGGQPMKMSKRTGKALTLDDLIAELGPDVVRFFFIMRGVNTQLEFDLDLAREHSEKNPVFYLQYAHARMAGVLRHAESEGISFTPEASLAPLRHEAELALIRQILIFPETVSRATRELEPQILAEYLRELAATFHKFFHECRVVAEAPPIRAARMRLLVAAKTTLGNGLAILGIRAPERM